MSTQTDIRQLTTDNRVSIVRCASTSTDAEVVRRTHEAIQLLGDYGRGLRGARKVAVKINAGIDRVVLTDGRQTELTDPAVVEGAIRAIRDVTDAEIIIGDAPTDGTGFSLYEKLGYPERLKPYSNVRLMDFSEGELTTITMPHERALFRSYAMHRELSEADAFVSLAKMKAHVSMGLTLCIKNLFGWTPTSVYGAPRMYLHDRLIRLPRVLADLAAWTKPCLNVVDGTVALNNSEWHGTPLRPGVIIAGTNIVSTDSVAARVMGCDPEGDYPNHPFFYRRNAIKLAADMGVGAAGAAEIAVIGCPLEEVMVPFEVHPYEGETDRPGQLQRGATCVERYLNDREEHLKQYRGRHIALRDGRVMWDGPDMQAMIAQEKASGLDWRGVPQLVVRCVPEDEEQEDFAWYARETAFAPGG
jgi:uncharacterized protein (DUF362 family)